MPRAAPPAPPLERAAAPDADTLDDLGRWGSDIARFHEIRNADALTREQLAALLVRYFPQLLEQRRTPQIITDIQTSWVASEIQTAAGLGLIEAFPNHTFEPSTIVTRGSLAIAFARVMRLLSVPATVTRPIAAPDLDPGNALFPDVQMVVGSGVMSLQDSGSFNAGGVVSGKEAAGSAERLLRIFQQLPH